MISAKQSKILEKLLFEMFSDTITMGYNLKKHETEMKGQPLAVLLDISLQRWITKIEKEL